MRRLLFVSVIAFCLSLVPTSASAQATAFCRPGEVPAFTFGFAALKIQLGPAMGDPVECAHPNDSNGDVLQNTTTGLSFWRKSTNTPTFTDGYRHWGLTPSGMVAWVGSDIDPPGTAVAAQPASAPQSAPQSSAATYLPAPHELPAGFVEKLDARQSRGPEGNLASYELRQYFRNTAQTGLLVGVGLGTIPSAAHNGFIALGKSFTDKGFTSQPLSLDGTDEILALFLVGPQVDQYMTIFRVGTAVGVVGWIDGHDAITPYEAGRQMGTVAGPMIRKMQGGTGSPPSAAPRPQVSAPSAPPQPAAPAQPQTAPPTNPTPPTPSTPPAAPPSASQDTCGAPANPWGYNLCGRGKVVSSAPANFCSVFTCIPSFWNQTNGNVVRCSDGLFSHSGGVRGACSSHGGVGRPVYGP
jgi:hypothetical protein